MKGVREMKFAVDLNHLRRQLVEELRKTFSSLHDEHPAETFYAYAISTDAEINAVFWAANSEEGLSRQLSAFTTDQAPEYVDEERWGSESWSYGGTLEASTNTIEGWSEGVTDDNGVLRKDDEAAYYAFMERI